jgi:hypothetical protein
MKVSLVFYPNKDKKSKRTGKTPIYARVCLKGLKAEERLTVQVSDDDLLKWSPMNMRFSDRNNSVNRLLNSMDQKFDEFIILNASSLYHCNPRKIPDHVLHIYKSNLRIAFVYLKRLLAAGGFFEDLMLFQVPFFDLNP